jgi:hypothetical protein
MTRVEQCEMNKRKAEAYLARLLDGTIVGAGYRTVEGGYADALDLLRANARQSIAVHQRAAEIAAGADRREGI